MSKLRSGFVKGMHIIGLGKLSTAIDSSFFVPKSEKSVLTSNAKLKNIHKGERCFIVGNGPSIKKQDLSLLHDEYTFTVNQLPRRNDYNKINSDFHLWTDKRFFDVDPKSPEGNEILNVLRKAKNSNSRQIIFYAYDLKPFVEALELHNICETHYIGEDYHYSVNDFDSIDLTKPIPGFSTVVHYAICVALYMGFTEIYLLGCDCTSFITTAQAKMKNWEDGVHYGYDVNDIEEKRLESSNNVYSMEKELLFNANVFKGYRELKVLCDKCGVKLSNATGGGLLESIDKVEYLKVLERSR